LLLEAGGDDDVPSVMDADQWFTNLGTERDWGFRSAKLCSLWLQATNLSLGVTNFGT
jgi:choline dehydrogenase